MQVLIKTNIYTGCLLFFLAFFNIRSFAWMKHQQGGVQSLKKKNLYRIFPPFISCPAPLSLGQALELGLGEERKQNKSLPDSSSNSAHSNSTRSNSAHSHSTQRERQPTKGQTFFFLSVFI